ncbi:hypothetical protein CEXT_480571 [Caerostris extrusa]|uniref:Uncharacterized protein n=1 Tax=Caerostris extrusa TaxID=172846 RepID=A0AAV4WE28_CAEEX|nr:hypothetical protein CEXT_480571 [Caerostris extrusa]
MKILRYHSRIDTTNEMQKKNKGIFFAIHFLKFILRCTTEIVSYALSLEDEILLLDFVKIELVDLNFLSLYCQEKVWAKSCNPQDICQCGTSSEKDVCSALNRH